MRKSNTVTYGCTSSKSSHLYRHTLAVGQLLAYSGKWIGQSEKSSQRLMCREVLFWSRNFLITNVIKCWSEIISIFLEKMSESFFEKIVGNVLFFEKLSVEKFDHYLKYGRKVFGKLVRWKNVIWKNVLELLRTLDLIFYPNFPSWVLKMYTHLIQHRLYSI